MLADRLIHHSLLVGSRRAGPAATLPPQRPGGSGAAAQQAEQISRVLVISESLFSMEGTSPAIDGLVNLCQQFGARLLVDEAHALGVGPEAAAASATATS